MPRNYFHWALAVVFGSLLCFMRANSAERSAYGSRFDAFVKVMSQVRENYVDEVEERELFENALSGMVNKLDPYTSYIPPSSYQDLKESLHQRFGGIGIQVELDEETKQLTVLSPLFGTPAHRAGIRAGDRIVEIEGDSTEGWTMDDAVRRLRGEAGTKVSLKILHRDSETPEALELTREVIEVATVLGDSRGADDAWNYQLAGHAGIGYLRLTSFSERTTDETAAALKQLASRGEIKGLIIDLRFNPGGLLDSAVDIADLFLEEGVIVSTNGRGGMPLEAPRLARKDGTYVGFPIVVLVNHSSASASEILAAALQDHGRAKVIGERTWGKGSVQHVIPLEDGQGALKLTIASYWRPSGRNIHRDKKNTDADEWGVMPDEGCDLKIEGDNLKQMLRARHERDIIRHGDGMSPVIADGERHDPQLLRALEVLTAK